MNRGNEAITSPPPLIRTISLVNAVAIFLLWYRLNSSITMSYPPNAGPLLSELVLYYGVQ
jgi:hypothetical protein